MGNNSNSLDNFKRAFAALELASSTPVLEPRDLAGIVKSFEFVFELSWKAVQAFGRAEGREINSPRTAFTEAFRLGWVTDPKVWVDLLDDRNRTVHTYDEGFAKEMCLRIKENYIPAFDHLLISLQKLHDSLLE
jgi:nucleotidyltransferase substrate binding protein (TIGR01987 family)